MAGQEVASGGLLLRAVVYGEPAPKGSARAFVVRGRGGARDRAVVTHDHPGTRAYGEAIALTVRSTLQGSAIYDGGVRVVVRFFVHRPSSLPRAVRAPLRTRGTDLDKLVRSVLDGLTRGGAYRDDVRVVDLRARKVFAGGEEDASPDGLPRTEIEVYEEPYKDPADPVSHEPYEGGAEDPVTPVPYEPYKGGSS